MSRKSRPPLSQRPTDEEEEARVAFTRTLLASQQYKHQIKNALRQFIAKQRLEAGLKKEAVDPKTLENYIARARAANREVIDGQIQDKIAEAIAFYDSILRDLKSSTRDRLYAQQRKDAILGLEAPKRTEITGGGGVPLLPVADAVAALEISYGADVRKQMEAGQSEVENK